MKRLLNNTEISQYFSLGELKRIIQLLFPYVRKHKKAYIGLFIMLLLDIALALAFAWFFGNTIDAAVQGNFERLKWLIATGVAISFLSMGVNFTDTYLETVALNGVKKDFNHDVYEHVIRMKGKNFTNYHSGELFSHFAHDLHQIEGVVGRGLLNLIRVPIISISVFIYLLHINWALTLVILLVIPLAILGGALFGVLLRNNSREIHELMGMISKTLNETFQGLMVIRSFTLESFFKQKYKKSQDELYQLELKDAKLRGWFNTGGEAVGMMTFLTTLAVGMYFVTDDILTIGALLTYINLVNHLVYPMTGLAGQWAGYQRSVSAIERIIRLLDQPREKGSVGSYIPDCEDRIEAKHITFSYDNNHPVFTDFTITLPANKLTAVVGPSGAGKSTLFYLLQGIYQPQQGTICVDGIPIDEENLQSLRQSMAYVPQETFLFSGTIRENLLVSGNERTTEAEMMEAAQSANIHAFIESLPEGYDTEIGERGVRLSGGQKQRLAIARALLKDAPILLLDEATSSLDNESEYLVQEALGRLMKGRTTVVIAHRLSTIQHADHILVLDQGRVVQQGTHEQLIRTNGLYNDLYLKSYFQKESYPEVVSINA
ncbi:ABC transporter ATP-binding protein [Halobacillus halophilus]|uniref:ABC transporter ATP-binding protein n=1 Tax=Halobacillus halophilus TaxID=1570 RepID=UPI001CD3D9CE|nr:ABC transporter ATP-binding protein [Halobacillus halophilus]MCA1010070.1 ABC transporter ATP-binding protein/permease [Halobacillus halophilus]